MRKMSIEDIKKPENATILQTYAVLHMGATEEQIGGIDGKFWPKTLAIFRKCQADGVWGNAIKSVNQAELGKVAWWTSSDVVVQKPETTIAEATTAASVATEIGSTEIWDTTPEASSSTAETGVEWAREQLRWLIKNMSILWEKLPTAIKRTIDWSSSQLTETGVSGVYKLDIQQVLGSWLWVEMRGDIYMKGDGQFVDASWKPTDKAEIGISMDI